MLKRKATFKSSLRGAGGSQENQKQEHIDSRNCRCNGPRAAIQCACSEQRPNHDAKELVGGDGCLYKRLELHFSTRKAIVIL